MFTRKQLLASLKHSVLKTPAIIKAFEEVDRADFVLAAQRDYAYINAPLHIASGQTISQPWAVAFMTEALEPRAGQKILEVGTGSGYQAAILSSVVGLEGKLITIEYLRSLFQYASPLLQPYKNVKMVQGDGSKGYKPAAPYDRVIVTAAAPAIPAQPFPRLLRGSQSAGGKTKMRKHVIDVLFEQLKEGGVMVVPVGQRMIRIRKLKNKRETEDLGGFMFVPLKGEHGFKS